MGHWSTVHGQPPPQEMRHMLHSYDSLYYFLHHTINNSQKSISWYALILQLQSSSTVHVKIWSWCLKLPLTSQYENTVLQEPPCRVFMHHASELVVYLSDEQTSSSGTTDGNTTSKSWSVAFSLFSFAAFLFFVQPQKLVCVRVK